MDQYLIAHDLGTSASKATLFDSKGNLIATSETSYPTHFTLDGRGAEQNPEDWWNAFCRNNRALMAHADNGRVEAVAVSGQMMACLPMSSDGQVLHPCMIWADNRAEEETQELVRAIGVAEYYRCTGNCPSANYTAAKVMWLKKHKPEIYEKTACFIQPKDYITYKLTGRFVTDQTDAGHMHLYDIMNRCWAPSLLQASGVDEAKLPQVISAGEPIQRLSAEKAALCGLPEGVLLVQGAGDGRAAMLGAGVYESGDAYICLGTSSWFCQTGTKKGIDPTYGLYKGLSLREGYYANGGTMSAGGLSYRWFVDQLCAGEIAAGKAKGISPFDLLNEDFSRVPAGANGVMFLPYLCGERAPYFDPIAKGAFLGLTSANTKADMGRAVLEGVALHLKIIMDRVEQIDEIRSVRMVGGGAKSPLWRQIIADVFGKNVEKTTFGLEAGSLGTAVLAGKGAGIYPDLSVVKEFNRVEAVSHPNEEAHAVYQQIQPAFEEAYRALSGVNRVLESVKHL